ncbi:MAG: hypothetical protein IPF95_05065 [Flavobacteriales bacterium]|nr:hypothetical protein [Flavobacteriales bacterium]MBK6944204.1 hypothetical protein [Flavobacteriales bacterium]MBK7295300.1 hypothetical protein [Flavobacteriales bacterium]HQX31770.1 hypothetical protein [Flavobacteriales bacterium]HQZ42020.1 hypothetical protein [Flavobacteriales bacterium]
MSAKSKDSRPFVLMKTVSASTPRNWKLNGSVIGPKVPSSGGVVDVWVLLGMYHMLFVMVV